MNEDTTVPEPTTAPSTAGTHHTDAPVQPDLPRFIELAASRRVITVHRRLVADGETVVGLYARLAQGRPGTFCFESAAGDGVWNRYSFIGLSSVATLSEVDGRAHWEGRVPSFLPTDGDPVEVLRESLRLLQDDPDDRPAPPGSRAIADLPADEVPPLTSGLVGYLGYDTVRRVETLPDTNPDDIAIPELVMMLAGDVVVVDHHRGELWLMANAINFDGTDDRAEAAWSDARDRVDAMTAALGRPVPALASTQAGEVTPPVVRRQRDSESYRAAVRRAVEHIHAGDAFQIVVSQRFDVEVGDVDAFEVYRALRLANPSPYLYLLRLDGFDVVGSSPEALVTVQRGRALTHPIAGSKPRGAGPVEDAELERELLGDPKERAEHLMLVDLGRNDLGRVCRPGTVEVVEFMDVRRYSHIMHLESSVAGTVADGRSALDVVLACFPAGTLSGAPKVRAMEIIDELELSRRALYGGVVGYFDLAGNADTAIAIRTAVLKDGIAHVQAGGGIVADSDPATEEAETVNKAAAVMRAIALARSRRRLGETG